ncbi:unnamed protein product, partial [Mesorhabditis belari]|uniref:Uncharacterized protein n=1 Tax=Mesorhabditis belari TaxID=2138241 RepID=A0AAF3E846_9BILA
MRPARPAALPWASPPLLRFRRRPVICAPIKYLFGVCLTALVIALIIVFLPLILLVRLGYFVAKRRQRDHRACSLRHCDLHWPTIGTSPGRAIITLHKETDANAVAHKMCRVLGNRPTECCISKGPPTSPARDAVVLWDQSRTRVQCAEELKAVLNEPHGLPLNDCSCVVVPGFLSASESCSGQSVLVFSLQPRTHPFCLPRLLALYSESQLVFEVEPRLPKPFISTTHPRLNVPLFICHGFYQTIQLVCRGPLSLVSHAFKREHPVWKAMTTDSRSLKSVSITKNRKPPSMAATEDDSTLMSSTALEEVVVSPKTDPNHKISNMSVSSSSRWVTWTKVGHAEHLLRAERLLRAATVELLTALVTGALRQHFRDQGIRHPPDVGASLCVSCRDFVPVEAARLCEAILLPLRLPTSVEGAVPRAWAVQRRMTKVLDGVLPNALKISQFLGSLLLPSNLAEKFSNALYGDNTVQISFLRAGGELSLDGIRIQSMLMFPAVKESVLASFCFVQCGSEMMLSLSLDKNTFPNPSTILANFRIEVEHLIDQLSTRLLTLSQSSFTERIPFLRMDPDAEEYCRDSESFARAHPMIENRVVSKATKVSIEKEESDYTLEELQHLLTTVQDELDTMKANPQGDRAEYIRKLTELENRMQRFHECTMKKLGSGITDMVHKDASLANNAVTELLAPYRQEPGMTGRRFSREYILVDSGSSNSSRKNSRHSF